MSGQRGSETSGSEAREEVRPKSEASLTIPCVDSSEASPWSKGSCDTALTPAKSAGTHRNKELTRVCDAEGRPFAELAPTSGRRLSELAGQRRVRNDVVSPIASGSRINLSVNRALTAKDL